MVSKEKPKVATITLSWNAKKDLVEVLDCVKRQTYKPKEVIVVDNGSTDGSVEKIRKLFPFVKIFTSKINTGYAKGYNICFSKVSKNIDYVVVLDQDIIIPDNYIEKIVEGFEKEPENTIILMCDLEEPLIKTFNLKEDYVKSFHGSCWSYRNVFRNFIKFEEKFFAYSNEADLSAQLLNSGFIILFYPECKAFHKHDSTKRGSFRVVLETRNWLWTIWRNYKVFDSFILSITSILHMYSKASRNNKTFYFLRGVIEAFRGLPYCIRSRNVCPQLSYRDSGEVIKVLKVLRVKK